MKIISFICAPPNTPQSASVAFSILTNPIHSDCTTFPASNAPIGSR